MKRLESSVSAFGMDELSAAACGCCGCDDNDDDDNGCAGVCSAVICRMPSRYCAPPVSTLHSGAKLGSERPASETGPGTDDADDDDDDDEEEDSLSAMSDTEAVLGRVAFIIARCADDCTVSSN